MIHELHTDREDQRPAVVVYARSGRVALVLHPAKQSAVLGALCARLERRGYAIVRKLPAGLSLGQWAAPDTPMKALQMAQALLANGAAA